MMALPFDHLLLSPEISLQPVSYIEPEALIDGDPQERASILVSDSGVTIGIWSCQPYAERFQDRKSWEICRILEGSCSLTDGDGRVQLFEAGDSFIVPKGFTGIFRVHTPYLMHFMTA